MRDSARQIHDLLLLISYVQRNKGAPVEEVSKKLGVAREDLLRYVDTLLLCGKPPFSPDDFILIWVENDRIYVDIDQSLGRPVRLTAQEALAISVALRTVATDGPYAETARSALAKIKAHLADDVADLVREMEHRITMEGSVHGAEERMSTLRQGLEQRREVEITYFSASSQKLATRVVQPFLLVQKMGYWYVVAYDRLRESQRIFKVERIREAKLTDTAFEIPDDFDDERFKSGQIFMPGQELRTARVQVSGSAGRAVADTLSPDEIEQQTDDAVTLRIRYANDEWLAAWVLSFGTAAEVLGPPDLRKAVASRAREVLEQYD